MSKTIRCALDSLPARNNAECCMCEYPSQSIAVDGSRYCDLHSPCACISCEERRAIEAEYRLAREEAFADRGDPVTDRGHQPPEPNPGAHTLDPIARAALESMLGPSRSEHALYESQPLKFINLRLGGGPS